MKYFIILICLFQWTNSFELEGTMCAGKHATSEPVLKYCDEIGGTILHRCCRATDNQTFVAIDLMEANLTTTPAFGNYSDLDFTVIDLRDNPDLVLSFTGDEFLTLTTLNELLVPDHLQCPGGSRVWGNITQTTSPDGFDCLDQIDICIYSKDLCVEDGAVCTTNGPDHFQCLCKSDYHGYKCLRYGTFPTGIFLGSSLGITVLISAILYWTQRRHVIK